MNDAIGHLHIGMIESGLEGEILKRAPGSLSYIEKSWHAAHFKPQVSQQFRMLISIPDGNNESCHYSIVFPKLRNMKTKFMESDWKCDQGNSLWDPLVTATERSIFNAEYFPFGPRRLHAFRKKRFEQGSGRTSYSPHKTPTSKLPSTTIFTSEEREEWDSVRFSKCDHTSPKIKSDTSLGLVGLIWKPSIILALLPASNGRKCIKILVQIQN